MFQTHCFYDCVKCGDILELFGPSGCGKTELLYAICVRWLLPVELGGHGRGVVVYDLDGKFTVDRLASLLRAHAREPLLQCDAVDRGASPSAARVDSARANLISRSSSAQFTSTLPYRVGAPLDLKGASAAAAKAAAAAVPDTEETDTAAASASGIGSGSKRRKVAATVTTTTKSGVIGAGASPRFVAASSTERVERVVEGCLRHLFIIRCPSPTEFVASLRCLPGLVASESERGEAPVEAVLVDGLSSFFYILKELPEIMAADMVRYLRELALDQHLAVVGTTLELFGRSAEEPYTVYQKNVVSPAWSSTVHTRFLVGRPPFVTEADLVNDAVHRALARHAKRAAVGSGAQSDQTAFVCYQESSSVVHPFSVDKLTGVQFSASHAMAGGLSTGKKSRPNPKINIKITSI